ncbi:MAG: hypothetical protein WC470_00320 [Candidatus Paceibacterota bacterium]
MENTKQKEEKIALELRLEYSLTDSANKEEKGEALAQIGEENLYLRPELGEPVQLSYREITQLSEADYRISLELISEEKLVLFDLGYQYEDFLSALSKFRNEMLLKDMLMKEGVKKSGVEAEFSYFDKSGKELRKGKAEPRLYETALVIIPTKGDFIRIPYSGFSEIKAEDYQVEILLESGEKIIVSQMGGQFDSFVKIISERISELSLESQEFFKEILPTADTLLIRKASRLMQEGEAVNIKDIEALSPELRSALEKKMEKLEMKEEYDYLNSIADQEKISLGFKKGLMGELSGDYLWFLIPIYSTETNKPGNAIAMEATAEKGGGKSTYFFRILPRKEYKSAKNIEALRQKTDNLVETINKAMIEINFRREPVYLTEEKLNESEYLKYKFAIEKLPALKTLRSLFIGRVNHTSPEQWQKDVNDLLEFNVSEIDDNKKWEKAEKEEK